MYHVCSNGHDAGGRADPGDKRSHGPEPPFAGAVFQLAAELPEG